MTPKTKKLLLASLREDVGRGDITTEALILKGVQAEAVIFAKSYGVFCGREVAETIIKLADPRLKIHWHKKDGDLLKSGQTICKIKGPAKSILKAERTALNFLGKLSGISTLTHEFANRVKGTRAKIYDTRKTTALWRELEKHAVRIGGGYNHRMGLWDQGFVKDNHWQLARDSKQVAKKILSLKSKNWVVEISRKNLPRLEAILKGEPKIILLDNFSPEQLKREIPAIQRLSRKLDVYPELEASGGINLRNVRQIARTGVKRISIGAITHSAPSLDFSLEVKKLSL